MEEPLLAPSQSDVDSEALPASYSDHENSQCAIVPHSINRYDWEELLRALVYGCVQSCANIWSKGKQCLLQGSILKQHFVLLRIYQCHHPSADTLVTCLSSVVPLGQAVSPVELTQTQVIAHCLFHAFVLWLWVLCMPSCQLVPSNIHADCATHYSGVTVMLQAERLEQLHAQASVQFDLLNEEHQVEPCSCSRLSKCSHSR